MSKIFPYQTGESWAINDTDQGHVVAVHLAQGCRSETCVLHKPTDHAMKDLPLIWRSDRHIFERLCDHGIGHPDPDQYAYWRDTLGEAGAETQMIHGCDGCCQEPERLCAADVCNERAVEVVTIRAQMHPAIEPDDYDIPLCALHKDVVHTKAGAYSISRSPDKETI